MYVFRYALGIFLWAIALFSADPEVIYATWKADPSTTMVIIWHTPQDDGPLFLAYKDSSSTIWHEIAAVSHTLANSTYTIYRVELEELTADTEYMFHIGQSSKLYRFRTMPSSLTRPLRVAVGGDAYLSGRRLRAMNIEVASRDPDFVILAGDLAYTEGLRRSLRSQQWKLERWKKFFKMWSENMITKEERLIPLLPVLGNHDVREGFDRPSTKEVFFYQFFVFPTPHIPYWVLSIGNQVCFYLLDSGHSYPIGGRQSEWLESALQSRQNALYHIPVYHIAAYPSESAYSHRGSQDIRKFWVPLFEKYGVKIALEHDNHTYKRTFPLRKGKVDPLGILYLGDGSWGVPPARPKKHWYLHKSLQKNCYWLLTIDKDRGIAQAFSNEGELLDEVSFDPRKS